MLVWKVYRSWKFLGGHVSEMCIRNSNGNIRRSVESKSQLGLKLKAREIKLRITGDTDLLQSYGAGLNQLVRRYKKEQDPQLQNLRLSDIEVLERIRS